MDNLAVDNTTDAPADNQLETGPAQDVNVTDQSGGQAPGATPTDDIFKGVDPAKLPPELKANYDSMLKDYRDKTARLSETIKSEAAKATEAYKAKAEFYDQIAQQEEFVKQWNEYVQKAQAVPESQQPGDPILNQMKTQLQELNQKIQLSEMTQVTESFADAVDDKGSKLHPDFDRLNEIVVGNIPGQQGAEECSLLRACVELAPGQNPGEKLAYGYRRAKALHDQIFEAGRKAGMGRVQTKLMNGSNPPSNSSGEVLSTTEKKPKSAREAMEMARRGIMVSRD